MKASFKELASFRPKLNKLIPNAAFMVYADPLPLKLEMVRIKKRFCDLNSVCIGTNWMAKY